MSRDDEVEVSGTRLRETEKAMLVDLGEREIWVPFSVIASSIRARGNEVSFFVAGWFARKEDLS
jgi:peroxiredoxin family protein